MFWFNGNVENITDAHGLNPFAYYDRLKGIWDRDTCAPRMQGEWSQDNPTLGHCSVTSFLMQDLFGGSVMGIELEDGNYHCFNVVDGCSFDLTSEQFHEPLDYTKAVPQQREVHFAKAEKKQRYELLKERLLKHLPRN